MRIAVVPVVGIAEHAVRQGPNCQAVLTARRKGEIDIRIASVDPVVEQILAKAARVQQVRSGLKEPIIGQVAALQQAVLLCPAPVLRVDQQLI